MTEGSVMHEGYWSLRLGLKGWPSSAEDIIIARNVVLSRQFDAAIHMQHVSSAYGVDIIRRAKKRGIRVSGEATPHHLFFTDECCKDYNTLFKMNPPLRTEEDRQAIIEGVLDGSLDIIATDHAPHTADEKDCEFDNAPNHAPTPSIEDLDELSVAALLPGDEAGGNELDLGRIG